MKLEGKSEFDPNQTPGTQSNMIVGGGIHAPNEAKAMERVDEPNGYKWQAPKCYNDRSRYYFPFSNPRAKQLI